MDHLVVTAAASFIAGLIVGTLVSWSLLHNFYKKKCDAVLDSRSGEIDAKS